MDKNFDDWNGQKKGVDGSSPKPYKVRSIYWCQVGVNIGYEQDGTGKEFGRPVLVLRSINRETCFAVPLTTSAKKDKYRVPVGLVGGKEAQAIISQMRAISTRRLADRIGTLEEGHFENVKTAVKELF